MPFEKLQLSKNMKKFVIFATFVFVLIAAGCGKQKKNLVGDPEVERTFQGDWTTEYILDNENMRMRVKEEISLDTLTHTYKVEQQQEIIYPVTLIYANISYSGTWKADEDYFYGVIDQNSLKKEYNPKFETEENLKIYRDYVKDTADADMSSDELCLTDITPSRIHLIDRDRNVSHDLIKVRKGAGQTEEQSAPVDLTNVVDSVNVADSIRK